MAFQSVLVSTTFAQTVSHLPPTNKNYREHKATLVTQHPNGCSTKLISIPVKVETYLPGSKTVSGRPSWRLDTTNTDQVTTTFWLNPAHGERALPEAGAQIDVSICPAFLKEPLASTSWYIISSDGNSTYRVEEVDRRDSSFVYEEATMGDENKQPNLDLSDTAVHVNGFRWIGGIRFGQTRVAVEQTLIRQGFDRFKCRPWLDDSIKNYIEICATYKDDKFLGTVKNYDETDVPQQRFSAGYGLFFRSGQLTRIEYEFPKWRYPHVLSMLITRYGQPDLNNGERVDWPDLGDTYDFLMVKDANVLLPVSKVTIISDLYYSRKWGR